MDIEINIDKNSIEAMEEKIKEVQNKSKKQERMIRLNKKIMLAILVALIVMGLIESLMTGTVLTLINRDTMFDQNQNIDPFRHILIQEGEADDLISRKRRDHIKDVSMLLLSHH